MARTTTNYATSLDNDHIHRLLVQMGPRSSVSWRAVGYVVQTEGGLFATFNDERYQKVWDHWRAPRSGTVTSDEVVRFTAMDGGRQVHIATVRVPQWLVAEFHQDRRWARAMSLHSPSKGRLPGSPGRARSAWAAVERNAVTRAGPSKPHTAR